MTVGGRLHKRGKASPARRRRSAADAVRRSRLGPRCIGGRITPILRRNGEPDAVTVSGPSMPIDVEQLLQPISPSRPSGEEQFGLERLTAPERDKRIVAGRE